MGKPCLGDYYTHARCRLKADGGELTVKTSGCSHCRQQRCKTHCKCQGTRHAEGRHAPRAKPRSAPARARAAQPEPAPAEVPRPVVPAAVGRPAPLTAAGFVDTSWLAAAKREMLTARSVIIAALAMLILLVSLGGALF